MGFGLCRGWHLGLFIGFLCFLVPSAPAQVRQRAPYRPGRPIAIQGGLLIDGTGAPPRQDQTVLIEGERITRIGPMEEVKVPEGAEIIDAAGMTVMPGLINANQHIQMGGLFPAPTNNLPVSYLKQRWERLWSAEPRRAFVFLMQGITSMRNTSGPAKRLLPVKHAIDNGEMAGPRIFLGGGLFRSEAEWPSYIKSAPPDARDFLRNDLAFIVVRDVDKDTEPYAGPDFAYWKLRMGDDKFDGKNDFTDEEIRAFTRKAHRLGKKVDCHCGGFNYSLRRMMAFDIDTLEHPFSPRELVDTDIIQTFAKKGWIIATLLSVAVSMTERSLDPHRFDETLHIMSWEPDEYRILLQYRDRMLLSLKRPDLPALSPYDPRHPPDFPDLTLPPPPGPSDAGPTRPGASVNDLRKMRDISRENMRRFIKAGVKFAMGTDTDAFLNFQQEDPSANEMMYMVQMGMTPLQAIEAATRNGAEALGMLRDLGTVEKGKLGDVIVVAGNPLENMAVMKRVYAVVKGGVRYK